MLRPEVWHEGQSLLGPILDALTSSPQEPWQAAVKIRSKIMSSILFISTALSFILLRTSRIKRG